MDTMNAYWVTFGWMTDKEGLGLTGSELSVYALVHSYSQNEQGCYFGSLETTGRMLGFSSKTAQNAFRSLVEKGLLRKRDVIVNNVKLCQYTAVKVGMENSSEVRKKFPRGMENSSERGMEKISNNKKSTTDNKSIKESSDPLSLPFSSEKFKATWEALCEEKEWKKKTRNALQLTLNKLAKYHEDFAIELMEATIESGKWQRVVFPDTDAKYQEWKSARQQKIDNAVPRTSQQNKPRKIDPNNNVDAMYARLRAQKEAEERELREQLRQQYGDAYRPSGSHDDV